MITLKKLLVTISALSLINTIQPCATCLTKLNQKDKPFFVRYLSTQKTSTKETATTKNDKKVALPMKTVMK